MQLAVNGSQDDCGGGSEAEPADQRFRPEAGLRGGRHAQPHLRLGALKPARPARVEAQRETGRKCDLVQKLISIQI